MDITGAWQISWPLHVTVVGPKLLHGREAPHQLHVLFIFLCCLSCPTLRPLGKAKGVAVLELVLIWSSRECLLVRLL